MRVSCYCWCDWSAPWIAPSLPTILLKTNKLTKSTWTQHNFIGLISNVTFKNQILVFQVESFSMAFLPQAGGGWVVVAAAARLQDGLRVQGFPQSSSGLGAHPEREVLVWDVNVTRVVSLTGVFFASIAVLPRIRLVPVVRADGHDQESDGAQGQKEPGRR